VSRKQAGRDAASVHESEVAQYFDREAAGWDRKYERSRLFRRRRAEIARALDDHAGRRRRGLDYGCGSGALTDLVRRRCERTVATDLSPSMRDRARQRFSSDASVSVVEPAVIEAGAYDLVLCSSVVEYASDDRAFLDRLASYVRAGGVVVITFPHRFGPLQLANRLVLGRLSKDSWVRRQRHVYTVGSARARLVRAGLEPREVRASIGLPVLGRLGLGELIVAVASRDRAAAERTMSAPGHQEVV
jgi:2-polyprenyl-3-methyl-5-hydroxy-6-metoxy-1,4-benzoquinol methylase